MESGFKIVLREFVSRQPNGDRDTSGGSDCSDYKVVLINAEGKETVLRSFSGFDQFWTSHKPKSETLGAATKLLQEKADFFGAKVLKAELYRPTPPRPPKKAWTKVR
jgi:hypothetical protein